MLSERLAGKCEDKVQLARALSFRRVRGYGELPARMGLFSRLAPESGSADLERHFAAAFKQAERLGFKQID